MFQLGEAGAVAQILAGDGLIQIDGAALVRGVPGSVLARYLNMVAQGVRSGLLRRR
jgi:hypothetical protein